MLIWNHTLLSYVYITNIFVILLSRYYNGLFIANAWGRIGKIRSTAGEERMTECVWDDAESWGGGARDGRESVWVCARRLRGRDAKFRCSSLQRLIEYRASAREHFVPPYTHTHIHTHVHISPLAAWWWRCTQYASRLVWNGRASSPW